MAVEKNKQVVRKHKTLTKRDKLHRRVLRVHKAVEKKRKLRAEKKKKASLIRRKINSATDNEPI